MTPKPIPHDSEYFVSNGTKYFFDLNVISHKRLVRFLQLAPEINFGFGFVSYHKLLSDVFEKLTPITLNTAIEQVFEARQLVFDALKTCEETSLQNLTEAQVNKVWELCTLFIRKEGEDTTTIDPAIMERKISDWKKDMDFNSFFLLQRHVYSKFPIQLDLISFQKIMEARNK